jgi:uncharacterized membrane protein YtjA (UPF0391 family)
VLNWAVVFLIVGLAAGLICFTGLAGPGIGITEVMFFFFTAMSLTFLLLHLYAFIPATGRSGRFPKQGAESHLGPKRAATTGLKTS